MDSQEFVETVTDEHATALSRLGSSKALYAITDGEMESDAVRTGAADRAHYAAETVAEWDGDVATAVAETATKHYESITSGLDDHTPGDRPALFDVLAQLDDESGRLGGLVGWALVTTKTNDQLTGFFVGQADPQTAQTFREMGTDVEEIQSDALDALAETGEWERAADAAGEVLQAAYEEYVETLEDLGVNPKPVC